MLEAENGMGDLSWGSLRAVLGSLQARLRFPWATLGSLELSWALLRLSWDLPWIFLGVQFHWVSRKRQEASQRRNPRFFSDSDGSFLSGSWGVLVGSSWPVLGAPGSPWTLPGCLWPWPRCSSFPWPWTWPDAEACPDAEAGKRKAAAKAENGSERLQLRLQKTYLSQRKMAGNSFSSAPARDPAVLGLSEAAGSIPAPKPKVFLRPRRVIPEWVLGCPCGVLLACPGSSWLSLDASGLSLALASLLLLSLALDLAGRRSVSGRRSGKTESRLQSRELAACPKPGHHKENNPYPLDPSARWRGTLLGCPWALLHNSWALLSCL